MTGETPVREMTGETPIPRVKKLHSSDARTTVQLMGNAIASNASVPKFWNNAKIRA
jgi:hypothetical protein